MFHTDAMKFSLPISKITNIKMYEINFERYVLTYGTYKYLILYLCVFHFLPTFILKEEKTEFEHKNITIKRIPKKCIRK